MLASAGMRLIGGASLSAALSLAASAEPPARFCARVGNDDQLRPLPQTLLPAARAALSVSAPDPVMQAGTVFRCMAGKVRVCFVGANLPCRERREQDASPSEAAGKWCAAHPGADFVPKFVTGGGMIRDWQCSGTKPVLSPVSAPVDQRGFVASIWKTLP
jgi:hypothetical protein